MAAGDTLRRITQQDQLILDSSGNLVGLKNPNAGGNDLRSDVASVTSGTVGGAPVRISRALHSFHTDRVDQTAFTGYSWQTMFCLPEKADAVRIAVPAYHTSGAATLDAAVLAPTNTLASTTPSGSFVSVTFNGGDPGISQPASARAKAKGVIWSDWIPIASVDRTDTVGAPPAYALRAYIASANAAMFGNSVNETAWASYPLPFRTWLKSGDFVTTNQGLFTSPADAGVSVMGAIEYVTSAYGAATLNLSDFTDSIGMGFGLTDQGIGPINIAAQTMRAAGRRVAAASYAGSGRTVQNSFLAYAGMAPSLPKGTVVVFRPYSRNSAANTDSMRYAVAFLETCAMYGHTPILQTGFYESATPANNTVMQSVNALTRALAATAGVTLIELESTITAANATTTLQGDGIHPTTAGRAAIAALYVAATGAIQR